MIKASTIGKTILIWENLSDIQMKKVRNILSKALDIYKENCLEFDCFPAVPIKIGDNSSISFIKKHNIVAIATTLVDKDYHFSPIINCDALYPQLEYISESALSTMKNRIKICKAFPESEWVKLPYVQTFEEYALSPNINPEDFVKNLERGTLSETYKGFLKEVGAALEEDSSSRQIEDIERDD